jgi:hypothetical protein
MDGFDQTAFSGRFAAIETLLPRLPFIRMGSTW